MGGTTGSDPVASSSLSYGTLAPDDSSTACPAGSIRRAVSPIRHSIFSASNCSRPARMASSGDSFPAMMSGKSTRL
jgi:hypothetical protein